MAETDRTPALTKSRVVQGAGSFTLHRIFPQAPARVWLAWTDAGRLREWFSPNPKDVCHVESLDAQTGGRLDLELVHPDNTVMRVTGTFIDVRAQQRLAFSLASPDFPQETSVVLELRPQGAGTELQLTQSGFRDTESQDEQIAAWIASLNRLAQVLKAA